MRSRGKGSKVVADGGEKNGVWRRKGWRGGDNGSVHWGRRCFVGCSGGEGEWGRRCFVGCSGGEGEKEALGGGEVGQRFSRVCAVCAACKGRGRESAFFLLGCG